MSKRQQNIHRKYLSKSNKNITSDVPSVLRFASALHGGMCCILSYMTSEEPPKFYIGMLKGFVFIDKYCVKESK